MLLCNNNVSASLAGVTLMCLECIWKKLHCTESSSQFSTFYYYSTIYTSTYNFECINFHIIFLFVCLNVWCGSSSDETWDENINCSCHGCRLKNYYFFHLTKKTGLQVHPTTDMQVTESREEEKTEPSDKRRSSSVCFCYGLTSAGRKTLNVTWMELKSGRWMAEMTKYIYTYTYIHAKVERRMLVWISQAQFWVAGTLLDCFVQKHLAQ